MRGALHRALTSQAEYASKKKQMGRDRFLTDVEQVVPWARLVGRLRPLHTDGTTIHECSKLYGWGGSINLVWQYLDQHLSGYFIRAAHILITIDIEPTTELACHPIFADKCLASDLHNSTKWEQRGTGYRIAPPTNVHS